MVGQEGARVYRVREEYIVSIPQAPAFRLHRIAEANPTGVGICAADQLRHRGRLWSSRDGPLGHVHNSPLLGHMRGNPESGGHPPDSETGRSGPPRPNKDGR